jgi:hypothetical protein
MELCLHRFSWSKLESSSPDRTAEHAFINPRGCTIFAPTCQGTVFWQPAKFWICGEPERVPLTA